jgi:hypothetical protein
MLKAAFNPECLVPIVKHGGRSVMIWITTTWYIKFRRRGITQKKAYNIYNTAKV